MSSLSGDRERGRALFLVLFALVVVMLAAVAVLGFAGTSSSVVQSRRSSTQLAQGARLGLAYARHVLLARDLEEQGGDLEDTRQAFDDLGLKDKRTRWLSGGRFARDRGAGLSFSRPAPGMARLRVHVQVTREDQGSSTFLTIVASASDGAETRSSTVLLRVGADPFRGPDYGLFAHNLDRILFRTRIDTVERYYGTSSGPYDRVRVASLQTLRLRSACDSILAGTLYVRGEVLSPSGAIVPGPQGGASGLQGETLDAATGAIVGAPLVDLVDQTPGGQPYGNLYKNYPNSPKGQFDGSLPDWFPPVIPDENGNGLVDDPAWFDRTSSLAGRISSGTIHVVPAGSTYAAGALPSSGNAVEFTSEPGSHVILVGTKADPIVITGEVAVDGDAVLSGYVKGSGLLLTRGNLYLVGDVIYADEDGSGRVFGVGADGTANSLALAAGGSIVHGPYNTTSSGAPIDDLSLDGFTGQELSRFNAMEWAKSVPFFDPATKRPTTTNTGVANVAYVSGYRPRYFTLAPGATPQAFMAEWNNAVGAWLGSQTGSPNAVIDLSGLTAGVDYTTSSLNPQADWISQTDLRGIHAANDALRAPSPYELDAMLYTDKALLLMSQNTSSGGGQLLLNGAVMGGHTGVLASGGFQLNYDPRPRPYIDFGDLLQFGQQVGNYEGDYQDGGEVGTVRVFTVSRTSR